MSLTEFLIYLFFFFSLSLSLFGSILKSIEFPHLSSTVDEDDDDDQDIAKKSDKVPTSALAGGNKPLEVLLLERNKALQSENTALKVANSELQGKRSSGQIFSSRSPLISKPPQLIMFICNY